MRVEQAGQLRKRIVFGVLAKRTSCPLLSNDLKI